MNSITDSLTKLISEITQIEKNNTTLNEQLLSLEKEKREGYKSFNTETHILIEKSELEDILEKADSVNSDARYSKDEVQDAESRMSDASYYAQDTASSSKELRDSIERLLAEDEEGDE